ncbi:hypothetical protein ACFL3C_00875 [Patescibacteria group bacterium]
MNKVIFALIGFPLSFLIIIYRSKLKNFTGDIGFAEKYLGSGGTYTLFVLIGIGLFFATLMYITGTVQSVLSGLFGPILSPGN